MSKTTNTRKQKTARTAPRTRGESHKGRSALADGELGPKTRGCDIVIQALERQGVDVVFAYPGGASMELHQALTRSKIIRTILPRHEQGGVFMAEGYARATGRVGVCMATSGPGATNLMTGIADAYMDSTPLVAITGQVQRHFIGKMAFQETDVLGMTMPVVKHSYLVMDINDLPRVIKEAFVIASTGRPGPVLIDIPKDIQQQYAQPIFPKSVDLPGYEVRKEADPVAINEIMGLIAKSERPVLYCGGGIIAAGAHQELLKFAEHTCIPVTTTLMGIGCFPENHPLSMKWFGMHGTVYANWAADQSDLLLAIGVRFDDRVTGKVEEFAKHATIVHIDIDPAELNKNKLVQLPVVADVKHALRQLNDVAARTSRDQHRKHFAKWNAKINRWKKQYPFKCPDYAPAISPQLVIRTLCELTQGKAILTTGVGQHQMWAGQLYDFDTPRSFITSAGLGSMGFGYPAAIGAKVARPDQEVIDVDGDGSFVMNIQELATANIEGIAAKALILNNQHLGMVMQWEDRFYGSNRAHTFLGDPDLHDPKKPDQSYPDFVKIAEGFNVPGERITRKSDLRPALKRMLAAKTAYVLDVIVPYTEHVLPMIPGGKTVKDMIIE